MKDVSFTPSRPLKVRPDSKGRITLGKLAEDVSSFMVYRKPDGIIVLEPFSEIPAKERWLYENKEALAAVKKGLKESAEGKVKSRGSFKKYLKSKD